MAFSNATKNFTGGFRILGGCAEPCRGPFTRSGPGKVLPPRDGPATIIVLSVLLKPRTFDNSTSNDKQYYK